MSAAPFHPDEERRLAAVHQLGLLDTPAEARFDNLAELARIVLTAPIAMISLVDRNRQWSKSAVGIDAPHTPREFAFAAHAIVHESAGLFTVDDLLEDPRFRDNPLVAGDQGIRFYAGQTLHGDGGMPVGTLCVLDRRPRVLDDTHRRALQHLGLLVEQEFRRRPEHELAQALADGEARKQLILDSVMEGLVLQDSSGAFLEWNRAAAALLGVPVGQMADMLAGAQWDVVRSDGSPWPSELRPSAVARRTLEPVIGETLGLRQPDGEVRWLRMSARPVRAAGTHGDSLDIEQWHVVTTFFDVTQEVTDSGERHRLEDVLRRVEVTARVPLDALEQGVVFFKEGDIRRINPAAERILGYSEAELDELWKSDEWKTYDENGALLAHDQRPIIRALTTGVMITGQIVGWPRKDGARILVRVSVFPGSRAEGTVITFVDVTEEHLARKLLDTTLEVAPVGLAILSVERQILRCNKTFADHAGRPPEDLIGLDVVNLIEPEYRSPVLRLGNPDQMGASNVAELDHRVLRPDGVEMWLNTRITTIPDLERPFAVVATFDITERFQATEQLGHRALHDPLTDLANRELLETTIDRALVKAQRTSTSIALCFIDLDGFKDVNDTFGHATGDELLISVSKRINECIRDNDLAARLGGDEFVVMFDGIHSSEQAFAAAARLRDRLVGPHLAAGIECGASFGLAMSTPHDTRRALLARADAAMYRSKASGQSSIELDALRTGHTDDDGDGGDDGSGDGENVDEKEQAPI